MPDSAKIITMTIFSRRTTTPTPTSLELYSGALVSHFASCASCSEGNEILNPETPRRPDYLQCSLEARTFKLSSRYMQYTTFNSLQSLYGFSCSVAVDGSPYSNPYSTSQTCRCRQPHRSVFRIRGPRRSGRSAVL